MLKVTTEKTHKLDKDDNLVYETFLKTVRFFGVVTFRQIHKYECKLDSRQQTGFISGSQSTKKDT